ncbi:GNAT family N-acetyltransferase [Phyllobacterium zundukense]|nr:GNAT family N-acetyltransferase [Phyllobacterium zundukense]
MIRVEPLENHPELVPLCARWNFEEWGQSAGRTMEETVEGFLGFLDPSSGQKAFVGFASGLPVGVALLIDNDLESHAHLKPWLASLYVMPEMRGQGVGKALIGATENSARNLGHTQLYLYTSEPDYYRPLGWQDFETLTGDDAGLVILARSLIRLSS